MRDSLSGIKQAEEFSDPLQVISLPHRVNYHPEFSVFVVASFQIWSSNEPCSLVLMSLYDFLALNLDQICELML